MAADFYSSILGWLNQGTGNNNNSWGDNCDNSIFPIFEKAIAGLAAHAVTGGTLDLTDSAPPAGPTPALEMLQSFTGTLASNQIVEVPNLSKLWMVNNATTGAFTLTFKTPDGTASAAIPQGGWCLVWCDGDDNISVGYSTAQLQLPDGTLALPGLSFTSEKTAGLRRVSAGVVALTIGGVDIATFSADGLDIAEDLILSVGSTAIIPPGTEVNTAAVRASTGWYLEYGQTVARATDMPLMNAITEGFTANTNSTTVLSNVSKDLRGLGLEGSPLEGSGIPTGATIASIDSATQITLSAAATATASGVALRAFPYGNGNGVDTFTIPDARGTAAFGRDNMGGTAASKITYATSGVRGDQLNGSGGIQAVTVARANLPAESLIFTGTAVTLSLNSTQGFAIWNGGSTTPGGGFGFNTVFQGNNTVVSQGSYTPTGTINALGSGQTLKTLPPARIRNVMIKR